MNQKEEITKEMLEQGFSENDVHLLFKCIDALMALPNDLEQEFLDNIHTYEEEKKMPFIAPFEQIAHEKGRVEGREEGREEGFEKGKLEEAHETVIDILSEEFGELPSNLDVSIKSIEDISNLRKLRKIALKVNSLDEFMQIMNEFNK